MSVCCFLSIQLASAAESLQEYCDHRSWGTLRAESSCWSLDVSLELAGSVPNAHCRYSNQELVITGDQHPCHRWTLPLCSPLETGHLQRGQALHACLKAFIKDMPVCPHRMLCTNNSDSLVCMLVA